MFFSGLEKVKTVQLLSRIPDAAGMMSYWEYTPNLFAACADIRRMVMDSGAFSRPLGTKDIERYAKVICTLGERCEWYANADELENQRQSSENYKILLSLLPECLHSRVLWVYQRSAPLRDLEEGLERFPRLGIGGLVGLLERGRGGDQIQSIAERVAAWDREAHYFGVGQFEHLQTLVRIHQGKFTTDSTSWLVGVKYRRLIRKSGHQIDAEKTEFELTPEEMSLSNARVMRNWVIPKPAIVPRPKPRPRKKKGAIDQLMLFA